MFLGHPVTVNETQEIYTCPFPSSVCVKVLISLELEFFLQSPRLRHKRACSICQSLEYPSVMSVDFLKLLPPLVAHEFLFACRNLVLALMPLFSANFPVIFGFLPKMRASGGCHAKYVRQKGGVTTSKNPTLGCKLQHNGAFQEESNAVQPDLSLGSLNFFGHFLICREGRKVRFVGMENKKSSRVKAIIWVVLMDKKKQKITAGRDCDQVTAGELRDACCRKLRISSDGAEAFAIWICSPLLQIQMKPSHYPTALCDLWYDLLAQFSPVTESQAKSDQPIIMLMRNVFYPLSQEKMLIQRDPQARYYLTAESMFNFLTGRYPVEDELAFKLAAIQLKMEGKKMSNFPPGTLQNIANQILPWDVIKRNKKQSPIIDKKIRGYYNDLSNTTPGTLDHLYLSHWWTQACYRCAFFQGQVEVVGQKKDVPVRVGITPHNIFIWNKFTNFKLFGLSTPPSSRENLKFKFHVKVPELFERKVVVKEDCEVHVKIQCMPGLPTFPNKTTLPPSPLPCHPSN
eukprot:sb/3463905/